MKVKQCLLTEDNGHKMVSWIDADKAIVGSRIDLRLGDNQRSPVMTIETVWQTIRDTAEIKDNRGFGGSIR